MNPTINPQKFAGKLLADLGVADLIGLSLDELIAYRGAYIQRKPMQGAQGRILFTGSTALISVNSSITNAKQERFVLAHELGHFEMHPNLKHLFNCDDAAFAEWHQKGSHEYEANQFAAELLMPARSFKEYCGNSQFGVNLIYSLSDKYQTSLTSTAIRLAEFGSYPVGLVCTKDERIQWYISNQKFTLKFMYRNVLPPSRSATMRWFQSYTVASKPSQIATEEWFAFDHSIDNYKKTKLWELCLPLQYYNTMLTFLWFA